MSDSALFTVFIIVLLVPFAIFLVQMTRAQQHYLRLYRQAHPMNKLPEVSSDPVKLFGQLNRTGNGIHAYFEEQEDPELERIRQEVTKRIKWTFTWGFGVPIIFFVVVTVFGF